MSLMQRIQYWDETVLRWITENLRLPILDSVMVVYTGLGNGGWIFIAIALIFLCVRRMRKAGFSALSAMTFGLICTNLILKPLVARQRPWLVLTEFAPLVTSSDMNSFPSGHTCAAFSFGVAVSAVLPKKWTKAAALIAAALMGISRLYVGVHFPTDVLAGAIVGACCGCAGVWLGGKIISLRKAVK